MPRPPRVLITGVGLVTPLGADRETSWQGLLAGTRSIRHLPVGEPYWPPGWAGAVAVASESAGRLALDNRNFELATMLYEPTVKHAACASLEAASHAGIDWDDVELTRAACVVGTSKGGFNSWFLTLQSHWLVTDPTIDEGLRIHGRRRIEQFERNPGPSCLRLLANGAASTVASIFNLQGGAISPVTACATGLSSILRGADLIRHGECDVVLAGSSDASISPAVLASFRKLGVLADRHEDPSTAVKPFDRNRSGFLIGEGAGIVVLESEAHATARGAKPIAEWLTGGMACEASGITQLQKDPEALTWLIRDVLRRSGLAAGEIDYVSLHGTATKANDLAEVRAIKAAFGPAAYELSASSLKGAIGHLLGSAGSVEFAATLLAMRDSQLPPTMNLTDPDDECDLDFVAGKSKPREVTHAMKLSLGFGGHLVAGVIRKL